MRRSAAIPLTALAVLLASGHTGFASESVQSPSKALRGVVALRADQAAKARALAKCRKLAKPAKRRSCIRNVRKRFRETPVTPEPTGSTFEVQVRDEYISPQVQNKFFSPDQLRISRGDSIRWIWNPGNIFAHNLTLIEGPAGVSRYEFDSGTAPSTGFTLTRRVRLAGTYLFGCTLHHLMRMTVEVGE